jgi:hypothetical protein
LFVTADTVWSFHFPAAHHRARRTRRQFCVPVATGVDMEPGMGMAAALTVRHRDEQLVALGQRRAGPRVVEVEVEVVL